MTDSHSLSSVNQPGVRIECRDYVRAALRAEQLNRSLANLDWIDAERLAVTMAANEWAQAHGRPTITVDDVKRLEQLAVGHSDYTLKLSLYVSELVCGVRS